MAISEGQRKSRLQENRITKSLTQIGDAARTMMVSGALWFAKSDVVSKLFQIEAKTKVKPSKSMTIKKEWMDKIEQEAFDNKRTPALVFSFGGNKDYFILPDREFLELVEELIELRKENDRLTGENLRLEQELEEATDESWGRTEFRQEDFI